MKKTTFYTFTHRLKVSLDVQSSFSMQSKSFAKEFSNWKKPQFYYSYILTDVYLNVS